jgi:ERCC4-type nuclease
MLLKIDNREKELYTKIQALIEKESLYKNIQLSSETLTIGDIIIHDEKNNKDIVIIERKSTNDLLSSIKDGRYDEQSYRLNGSTFHNHNIIYLIEGSIFLLKEKKTIYSSIISLLYFKGFSLLRSIHMDETAEMICHMAFKLEKETDRASFFANNSVSDILENENNILTSEPSNKNYIHVVKNCKKDNITVDNIDEIMLSQIPGVSSAIAISMMKKYSSIKQLIEALNDNIDCLNNISMTCSNGQQRKISKTSIANIVKYLMKIKN